MGFIVCGDSIHLSYNSHKSFWTCDFCRVGKTSLMNQYPKLCVNGVLTGSYNGICSFSELYRLVCVLVLL